MPRRWYDDDWDFPQYVSAAERRDKARRRAADLAKKGRALQPVTATGTKIGKTFWGRSWCENLERYSDYANRLPRGRTYLRNGSVIDLQITKGEVAALVSGTDLYETDIRITPVPLARWKAICTDCAGAIDSVVDLLRGQFSKTVMARLCQQKTGLFPAPAEIKFDCSCPDSARMCKHVAAVLYGVGARLDESPELLFTLRNVNQQDLIAHAGQGMVKKTKPKTDRRFLQDENLSDIFGIDIATPPVRRRRRGVKKMGS
jgi:uncharacterized Zn finger protein